MTREQCLDILILISALESLMLAHKIPFPQHLSEDMEQTTEALRKEILK